MADERKLIVCPFAAEARMLLAVLPECRKIATNSWQSKDFLIKVLNGAGEKPVLDFFSGAFEKDSGLPDRIILFGSAGALTSDIEPGQLFLCDKVSIDDLAIDLATCLSDKSHPSKKDSISGIAQITVRRAVFAAAARTRLFEKTGAAIVDMESYFFVREALKLGIKPIIIRFISDTADFPFKMPFPETIRQRIISSRHNLLTALQKP